MKNLHYLKKFVVMVLAAMMTLSTFAMPTFAAGDKAFTVKGIESGAQATAYLLVSQNERGELSREQGLTSTDIAKMTAPTVKEITDLALKAQEANSDLKATATVNVGDSGQAEFSNLDAGMYLVLIKNAKGNVKIYNPILMSVGYDVDEAVVEEIGKGNLVNLGTGDEAIAKVQNVTFNKAVSRGNDANANDADSSNPENGKVTGDGENGNQYGGTKRSSDIYADSGDTASRGDTVWFNITSAFPAYADNYKKVVFNVHDTLSDGLTLKKIKNSDNYNVKVFIGNTEVDAANYTLNAKDSGFDIEFNDAFIKSHGNTAFEVRYCATVDNDCKENFDPETNTAWIDYTNAPGQTHTGEKEKITTYHYTFTINGQINGPKSGENREVVKVGVNESGEQVFEESTWKTKEEGWKPLPGATFYLYKESQMKDDLSAPQLRADKIREAKSREDGMLMDKNNPNVASLDRLDAGVYYLVEQSIDPNPDRYAVNGTPIRVEISAVINELGTLESYKVIVGGKVEDGKLKGAVVAGDYKVDKADYEKNYNEETDTYTVNTVDIKRNDIDVNITKTWDFDDEKNVVEVTAENGFDEAADIRNSKTGTLPSTGGMGTVLFTVGGIAIMALALLLLFGGKKRKEQE